MDDSGPSSRPESEHKMFLRRIFSRKSANDEFEDEIISMVRRLSSDIKNVAEGEGCVEELASSDVQSDPRKSIKEKSITCMECGKTFKILTRKHLASHNLDAAEYREKWGLKKDTPLVCKGLQRERRKKMKDMKLWEKRRKVEE